MARLAHDQRGQGLVEYGLIILLVAVAAIVALTGVGVHVASVFDDPRITSAL